MIDVLKEYIIRNKKNFIIIVILFCIGISVGVFSVNISNEYQKSELNNYIGNLILKIKESNNINNMELLRISIKENVASIIIIWLLGCTIIGGMFIYIAIVYKGFSLGYTISAIIAVLGFKQGVTISVISLLFQNIIFLFAYFLIAENRD